jgi:hypothetical protein
MLPASGLAQAVENAPSANQLTGALAVKDLPIWQLVSGITQPVTVPGIGAAQGYTWYIGGTLPDWKGATIVMAVVLEEDNPQEALKIGFSMFQGALTH